MKSGKRQMTEETQLTNQGNIRTLGELEIHRYLRILEKDNIKQAEMKEKNYKEYLRRTRKQLETKVYCRNLLKGKNNWAFLLVRYSGLFLKWTRELQQMDQRTRKLMMIHKALHPRDDIDSLYVSRKEGERGLTSFQYIVDATIQRLEDYIKKSAEEDWLLRLETIQTTQASTERK